MRFTFILAMILFLGGIYGIYTNLSDFISRSTDPQCGSDNCGVPETKEGPKIRGVQQLDGEKLPWAKKETTAGQCKEAEVELNGKFSVDEIFQILVIAEKGCAKKRISFCVKKLSIKRNEDGSTATRVICSAPPGDQL